MLPERALPRNIVLAATLLAGCDGSFQHPPVLDAATYDLQRPGITCMRELRHDEARGCTREVVPGEAELRVEQRDEMGSAFLFVSALYALDGRLVYLWNGAGKAAAASPGLRVAGSAESAAPPGTSPAPESTSDGGPVAAPRSGSPDGQTRPNEVARTEPQRGQPILDINLPPGPHVLEVRLRYQGNGYGVFAYLKGYKFDVRSTHSFVVAPGALTVVTVNGHEKGGVTTPLEERPAVRWVESNGARDGAKPAPP